MKSIVPRSTTPCPLLRKEGVLAEVEESLKISDVSSELSLLTKEGGQGERWTGAEGGGIGIDIIEISRFRNASCFGRLCEYILTDAERGMMRASRDAFQFVASRFAAKEAVMKAFPHRLMYQDIEIAKEGAAPVARIRHSESGSYRTLVSISHSMDNVVGMATVERV